MKGRRGLWRMWWAGISVLAALLGFLVAVALIEMRVGSWSVSWWAAAAVMLLAIVGATWLMGSVGEELPEPAHRSTLEAMGGIHPKMLEPMPEYPEYCGVHVAYHLAGEDDEPEAL